MMYHKNLKKLIKDLTGQSLYDFELIEVVEAVEKDKKDQKKNKPIEESIFFQ